MSIQITLLSAVDRVTGACTLVEAGSSRVLVDLGLIQGDHDPPPDNTKLPVDRLDWLDGVILTHAHIDHCGRMPMLARHGYQGSIFTSSPTADLLDTVWTASARVQRRLHYGPIASGMDRPPMLYDQPEVNATLDSVVPIPWHQEIAITPNIQMTLIPSGHVLGAASVLLHCQDQQRSRRILISGDIGPTHSSPIPPPHAPPDADVVIMECTRGDIDTQQTETALESLDTCIRHARASKQIILAPVFALGRTQSLLHRLAQLNAADPLNMPIVLDSKAGAQLTSIHMRHMHELNDDAQQLIQQGLDPLRPPSLQIARSKQEARFIRDLTGPALVMAGHGFAEGGAILSHLKKWLPSPRARIALVGFMHPQSLGGRLAQDPPRVRIDGRWHEVQASIDQLEGFSGHADASGLQSWLESMPSGRPLVCLHHGDAEPRRAFAGRLQNAGWEVCLPAQGEPLEL